MPSWQANMVSLLFRVTCKPVMRTNTSLERVRGTMSQYNAVCGKLPLGTTVKSLQFPTFNADWISVPESNPCRIILYFPGGGFITRSPPIHRSLAARLCQQARARALVVHYRLAPEDPFPAGLRDCLTSYHHLLEQGVSPRHITIGGDSAGGCMTLASLLALRDEETPLPAGAFLISPVADLTGFEAGSRQQNRWMDPMLTNARGIDMRKLYVGHDESLLHHPHVSPVYGDFTGLPPLLFQVGNTEILRDDSVRVAEKALAAGVPAEVEIWEGVPHVWHAIPFLPEAKRALARLAEFVRRCTLEIDLTMSPQPDDDMSATVSEPQDPKQSVTAS